MSLGKRLLTTGAASSSNLSETTDIFGDSSGIALYQLDYDGSSSPDASTSYNGTSTDVEFGFDGYINWGAKFNGSSSEITASNFASLSQVGISMWVNMPNISQQAGLIARYGTNREFAIYMYSGNLTASIYYNGNNGNATTITTSTYMSNNTWHHIAYTANGSTAPKLYIDGSEVGTPQHTDAAKCAYYTSSEPLDIGHFAGISSYNYEGKIDQVRIFNRLISGSEVATLFAETAISHTGTTDTQDYIATNLAYYQLDSSADDAHSGTYNGTESNITYQFGRYGAAAVFSGSTSYIDLPVNSSLTKNNDFTWSMWFNLTSTTLNDNQVLFSNNSTSTSKYFVMLNNSTLGSIRFYGQGLTDERSASGLVTAGKWFHLVVTKSSTEGLIVYLDNLAVITLTGHTGSYAIGSQANSKNVLGGYYVLNSFMFPLLGSIDQVRIFDSALSSSQVTQLYQEQQVLITKNGSNPFADGNEKAFYKLENNVNDSTGSYNGTNSGATFTTTDALFGTYSASFDGSSHIDVDSLTSVFGGKNTVSLSLWFNTTTTARERIFSDYAQTSRNIDITIDGGNIDIVTDYGSATAINFISSADYNDGNWHHIVVAIDQSTSQRKIYIDHTSETETATLPTPSWDGYDQHVTIGAIYAGAYGQFFNGKIDQVRIFNRALDGDEVFKLYAEVIN